MPYLWINPAETDPVLTEEGAPFPPGGATVPVITDYYQNLISAGLLLTQDPDEVGEGGPVIPNPVGEVLSVFGRTGHVAAVAGDYSADEISYEAGTVADALDALSTGAVPSSRSVTAGAGLTGGGDLSTDRSFAVGATNTSIVVAADGIAVGFAATGTTPVGSSSGGADHRPARHDHSHEHGPQLGGALHAVATTGTNGFMSAADKTQLADHETRVDALELPEYLVAASSAALANERVLSATAPLVATPSAGALTLTAPTVVVGPVSATDNVLPRFDGTTGKLIQASGLTVDDSNNVSGMGTLASGTHTITGNLVVSGTVDGRDVSADGAALDGKVTGPASAVDNRVARFDLTTGKLIQSSVVTMDDSGNCSGLGTVACGTLTVTGNIVVSGTVDGVDVSTLATTVSGHATTLADKLTGALFGSFDNAVVRFDGTGGKTAQNSSVLIDDAGNVSGVGTLASGSQTITGNLTITGTVDGRDVSADGTTLDGHTTSIATKITGPASSLNSAIVLYNGTTGKLAKDSLVTVDSSGNITMPISATVDGVDVSTLPASIAAKADVALTSRTVSGTTDTLVLTDAGRAVDFTSLSNITVTVPNSSTVAYPTNTLIALYQLSTGQISLSPAGGVTINHPSLTTKSRAQWSVIFLRYRGSNLWVVSGDLAAV